MHLHRAMFTDELYQLYKKYELAVHKKERPPDQLNRFICSSPVYDQNLDEEIINRKSPYNFEEIDKIRTF